MFTPIRSNCNTRLHILKWKYFGPTFDALNGFAIIKATE